MPAPGIRTITWLETAGLGEQWMRRTGLEGLRVGGRKQVDPGHQG